MRLPSRSLRRTWLGLAVGVAVFLGGTAVAQAHIQVTPTVAAPADAVKFTVIVPGESTANTVKVTLKIPADVLPFSFSDPPGWTRKNVMAANGAIDQVEWTGELAPDGFVEFAFIAGTPEQPGEVSWKALQEYSDGQIVRWIGTPDSEEPAAVTEITADAPRQNAGGESGEGGEAPTPTTTGGDAETTTTAEAAPASDSSSGSDTFARTLAIAAIALAVVALVLVRRPRRKD